MYATICSAQESCYMLYKKKSKYALLKKVAICSLRKSLYSLISHNMCEFLAVATRENRGRAKLVFVSWISDLLNEKFQQPALYKTISSPPKMKSIPRVCARIFFVSELYEPSLTRQNHPLEPSVKECPGKGSVVAIFIFSRCLAEELSCGSYVNAVKHEWLTLIPPVEKIQVLSKSSISTSSVTTSSMNLSKC